MKNTFLVLGFSFVIGALGNAQAANGTQDNFYNRQQSFYQTITDHQSNCAGTLGEKSICSEGWRHQDLYAEGNQTSKMTADQVEQFKAIAFDQAQVWGDTILEGDYVADGKTVLDSIFAIYQNNKLVAYYIEYHEKAWFTGECDYNHDDQKTLDQCMLGKITEGAYISPDLKIVETDPNNFADFR